PVSTATARSSSVIALAIQVTSWCETRLRSAVTSPPPPRRAVRPPEASRPNVTGPRFETTISLRRSILTPERNRPAIQRNEFRLPGEARLRDGRLRRRGCVMRHGGGRQPRRLRRLPRGL